MVHDGKRGEAPREDNNTTPFALLVIWVHICTAIENHATKLLR